ncbi:MAG TPA: hypothetical protein VN874_03180 [Myxococcales bacterium]|nr:hypothetical protein [Myxococcales bacterium]
MQRTMAVVCACAWFTLLGCGNSGPPATTGGACVADGGPAFAGTMSITSNCVADHLDAGPFPFKPTCGLPHTPTFTSAPVTTLDPGSTTCVRPSKISALAQAAQTFCSRGVGTTIFFNVPQGTGSVTVISQAHSGVQDAPVSISDSTTNTCSAAPNSVAPTFVTDPNQRVLLDFPYVTGDPVDAGIYYASLASSTGAMTFPDSAYLLDQVRDGGLPAGQWNLSVDDLANDCSVFSNCTGGSKTGVYDVTIIAKPMAPPTGTVDVGIYLVNAPGGLTAANAATAAQSSTTELGRMFQTLQTLYGNAGICLGSVTFYDVPSWAQGRYSAGIDADHTEPCSVLDQMFANLSQPGNTLNFFFVASITSSSQAGTTTVGIDGTIPGPSTAGGTVHSGAAVSSADLLTGTGLSGCTSTLPDYAACGPDKVAYIAAHEGGHALGLYHTVESLGDAFDPLSDTPQCPCATCIPDAGVTQTCGTDPTKSYQLKPANCLPPAPAACGSGDNLMFWEIGTGSTGALSAQQKQVMLGNPVVQ